MPTSPEKRESLLWRDQYDRTAHASVSLYLNPSHSSHSLRFQPRATRPPLRSSFSFSILWLSPLTGPQLSHTPSSRLFPSPHDLHQVEENVVCQTVGERGVDLSRFSQQRTVCGRIPSPLWVLLTSRCSDFCFVPISVPSLRFDSFLRAWIIASSRTNQERAATRSRNHSIKPSPSIRLPLAILILEIRHWFILSTTTAAVAVTVATAAAAAALYISLVSKSFRETCWLIDRIEFRFRCFVCIRFTASFFRSRELAKGFHIYVVECLEIVINPRSRIVIVVILKTCCSWQVQDFGTSYLITE